VRLAVDVRPAVGSGSGVGAGSGVGFVLVHGLASNARMWTGVGAVLSEAGHPVAAVDLRGHGRSPKPDEGYDFATVVADVVETIAGLGPGFERPVVVGQSWGGNVVVELAFRHPEAVRGVAGVDGLIELWREFPTWESCAMALAPPRLAGRPVEDVESSLRLAHPDWPESGIAGMLANFEVRGDGTVAPWLTFDRHMKILRALWEHRPSEVVGSITVPLLFIPARSDFVAPAGKVVPMEGDHDLHAQYPDKVAAVLLDEFA
jgi:pimeloyl-ACP methyl ester carboxylesterase